MRSNGFVHCAVDLHVLLRAMQALFYIGQIPLSEKRCYHLCILPVIVLYNIVLLGCFQLY